MDEYSQSLEDIRAPKREQIARMNKGYYQAEAQRIEWIMTGKEKDVHYFNDLAASKLEKKKNRTNNELVAKYPEVFTGTGLNYDLEYQITGKDKPKCKLDAKIMIDVEARLFATKEGRTDIPGFLYVMDTTGQWYGQTIRPSEESGKWKAETAFFRTEPSLINNMLANIE